MALTPRSVFRPYETDGVPSSGAHKPKKSEIIQLLEQIFGSSRGGWVVVETLADLEAVTPDNETDGGRVLKGDGAGDYYRDGGEWVFGRGLPDTVARLTDVAGTNDITGTTLPGVNPASVLLFNLDPVAANTGPVRVNIDSAGLVPLNDYDGTPIAAGVLLPGKPVLFFDNGDSTYRLWDTTLSAREIALQAKADAVAAAEASGDVVFFDTKADATAALGGLAEGQVVRVFADESNDGAQVFYRVESAALVVKVNTDKRTQQTIVDRTLIVTPGAYGAMGDGLANDTDAMLAFFGACIESGLRGRIPKADYLITPGELVFSSDWTDKFWPNIDVEPGASFTAAADVDAPFITIENGEALAADYRLWRGGRLGGLTFIDPFAGSAATGRHGLCLRGMAGTKFGFMRGRGLKGDLVHIERKLYGGTNPDPYNILQCEFDGIDASDCRLAWNNDNFVAVTHCFVKFIRATSCTAGGMRGAGTCTRFAHISMGNNAGWALDFAHDTVTVGRVVVELVELDNVENGIRLGSAQVADFKDIRIVHRYQTAPNSNPNYWPRVAFSVSDEDSNVVREVDASVIHRVDPGGVRGDLGVFVDFNNSVNVRRFELRQYISDEAGFGFNDWDLHAGLATSAYGVRVWNGPRLAVSRQIVPGCVVSGTTSQSVSNSGYLTEVAKLIFPTVVYDAGEYYDDSTGFFRVPYSGLYRVSARVLFATGNVGTKVRLGFATKDNSESIAMVAGKVEYAGNTALRSYELSEVIYLAEGLDLFFLAEQNTAGPIALSQQNQVNAENRWSVEAVHR